MKIIFLEISSSMTQNTFNILEKYLSQSRRTFLRNIYRTEKKESILYSELLTKMGINIFYGIPLSEIQIKHGSFGKPYIVNSYPIYFNVSHTNNFLVFGTSLRSPIGVDVETLKSPSRSLLTHCLHDEEYRSVIHSTNLSIDFFKIWTKKEAILKMQGIGISKKLNLLNTLSYSFPLFCGQYKNYIYSIASMYTETINFSKICNKDLENFYLHMDQ